ncbi:unnamed protein product, partial [Ixodes persulcatus]
MKVLCVLAVLAASSSLVVSHIHIVIIEKTPVVPVYQDYSYQRPHQSYETSYAQPYPHSYVQSYARPTYVQSYRQPYGHSYGGYGAYDALSFGKHKHLKHHHGRSYSYPVKGHKTKKQVVYRERVYVQPKVQKFELRKDKNRRKRNVPSGEEYGNTEPPPSTRASSNMNRPRYDVPPELTNLLLEFTVNVMIERPTDLVDYAVRYFTGLREERLRNASSQQQSRPPAIDENDEA